MATIPLLEKAAAREKWPEPRDDRMRDVVEGAFNDYRRGLVGSPGEALLKAYEGLALALYAPIVPVGRQTTPLGRQLKYLDWFIVAHRAFPDLSAPPGSIRTDQVGARFADDRFDQVQGSMLIRVGQRIENGEGVGVRWVPSVIGLYRIEEIPKAIRESWWHVWEAQRTIVQLRGLGVNGELRPRMFFRGGPAFQQYQLPGKVIEGNASIVDGFSEEDRSVERKWLLDRMDNEHEIAARVVFEPRFIRVAVKVGEAKVVKLDQMLLGATQPLVHTVKIREGHYREANASRQPTRAYAEDSRRVRDTRPEEDRRVPGLQEDRQAPKASSMAAPLEGEALGTSPLPHRGDSNATHTRLGSPEDV